LQFEKLPTGRGYGKQQTGRGEDKYDFSRPEKDLLSG